MNTPPRSPALLLDKAHDRDRPAKEDQQQSVSISNKNGWLLFPLSLYKYQATTMPSTPSPPSTRPDSPASEHRPRASSLSALSSVDSIDVVLRPSKSDVAASSSPNPAHKLDRFGFILNMNHQGQIVESAPAASSNSSNKHPANMDHTLTRSEKVPSVADYQRTQRRIKKWNKMVLQYTDTTCAPAVLTKRRARSRKLWVKRLRKGIPDEIRCNIWMLLGNVSAKIQDNPGVYDSLVRQTISSSTTTPAAATTNGGHPVESPSSSAAAAPPVPPLDAAATTMDEVPFSHTKSFLNVQDTIERDIHRTFPRHSMFYDVDEDDDGSTSSAAMMQYGGVCGAEGFSKLMRDLDVVSSSNGTKGKKVHHREDRMSTHAILQDKGGQASLRRVLKAYSVYDRDVGYCQGMNFIAGMLLTLMSEEEAFWLFTSIMHDKPCQMHGMFGEGMSETHKVLYVAEKLIQQFLPKLHKHLERENVHITMFATQWLLTQYTSSFHFDLVTRVWDSFLTEGWKVTYRVMLALLTQFQATLLKMSFEEILAFFRTLPDQVEGGPTMEAAGRIPLRRIHIARHEKEFDAQLQATTP